MKIGELQLLKKTNESSKHIYYTIKHRNITKKRMEDIMFVDKKDLMLLDVGSWQAMMLVKQAKAILVNRGRIWYESKGLGRVPVETVEEILGTKIDTDLIEKKELKNA